jgi:pSer/pThr/pTyr-binding forkhead associated (FHA) protein
LFRIGAGAANDLVLTDDDFVSGSHASIKYDSHSLYIQDLGSRNGTYLNDRRLTQSPMTLVPGDQIRIGRTVFELQAVQNIGFPAHDDKEQRVP